jgi:outer membrane protein TolC
MLEAQIWRWPIDTPSPSRVSYMVSAQQSFPGPGKRALRERLALSEVDVAHARLVARARDIVADLRRTYAALYVARQSVDVTRERIALLRQIADSSQARYAAGRTAQQDVLKAVVEVSRLHEEQLMDEERARVAEARLNSLLARDPGAPLGPLMGPREGARLRPVAALQQAALDRQPDLQVARAEIARAGAASAVADSSRRPDFVVTGGYMVMAGERDAFTAAVGITWPNAPWSRKGVELAKSEARAEIAATQARYEAEVNRVRLMVQEAWIRADSAARRAALLRTSIVPQSRQTLEVSRVGYQADRNGFLDIIDNQRVLAEARLGYYRALAELEQARADLERAVGAPILEGSVQVSREQDHE